MNIPPKRMIISAGASGIGLSIAKRYIKEGARVATFDIDAEALSQSAASLDYHEVCDVCDAMAVQKFVDRAIDDMGGLDTIIANAGSAGPTALIEDIDPADWERTVSVNLTGQFNLLRACIPYLKQHNSGTVILMSSAAGRLGLPYRSPYAAAKWAVIGLKETLAMELGPHDISVNAILPGSVEGARMDDVLQAKADSLGCSLAKTREMEVNNVSMKRMIDSNEIADLAWYLSSHGARSISGQSIGICGNFETLR